MSDQIPHIAVITVHGVVHQQMPNGQYHPRAVYSDSFSVTVQGNDEQECIKNLKDKLDSLKGVENV